MEEGSSRSVQRTGYRRQTHSTPQPHPESSDRNQVLESRRPAATAVALESLASEAGQVWGDAVGADQPPDQPSAAAGPPAHRLPDWSHAGREARDERRSRSERKEGEAAEKPWNKEARSLMPSRDVHHRQRHRRRGDVTAAEQIVPEATRLQSSIVGTDLRMPST